MSLWLSPSCSRLEGEVMLWEGGKAGKEREEEKGRKGEF